MFTEVLNAFIYNIGIFFAPIVYIGVHVIHLLRIYHSEPDFFKGIYFVMDLVLELVSPMIYYIFCVIICKSILVSKRFTSATKSAIKYAFFGVLGIYLCHKK